MRHLVSSLIAAGLTLGLAATGTPPAGAEPPPSGSVGTVAVTSSGRAVRNASDVSAVTAFWTPERMASAVSLDLHRDRDPGRKRRAKPTGTRGSVAPAAPRNRNRVVDQAAAVGKVYMTTPAGPRVCSASALNSASKRLIITAGHCLHGGAGGRWYADIMFVPALRHGVEPYGRFVASYLTANAAWIADGNPDEDMAIAVMHNGGVYGAKVVDTVGGMGLQWNWGYAVDVTILGYPADGYPGDVQYSCQSRTWHAGGRQVRAWCAMTGGSSGGPWLRDYNGGTGLGYVNSVVSHRDGDARQMDGPYFDNDIENLFTYAERLSPA
ncbi:hypothetical protein AMIS_49790 [Actinoplanes missouriensis 431]|uniref:V8-like Glu-specific endopeptidase n=1 Tax=Actinoplanes missouriensis (strain ATCC 14538 / DSM 43046 / CBS 188.64 / JCM 3121 / NBRC 102363 / NCIMB 12654 / NRRL B-3342 / UNCC 431) TaxID=512565 RepID=I0HB12_ACTM4|nr:hypothetical protein [Actinoplanes missouriensis]BAL90199.1 hypothetical protein AMIS_49790 [Actinoplanes missouriensis 431]